MLGGHHEQRDLTGSEDEAAHGRPRIEATQQEIVWKISSQSHVDSLRQERRDSLREQLGVSTLNDRPDAGCTFLAFDAVLPRHRLPS